MKVAFENVLKDVLKVALEKTEEGGERERGEREERETRERRETRVESCFRAVTRVVISYPDLLILASQDVFETEYLFVFLVAKTYQCRTTIASSAT